MKVQVSTGAGTEGLTAAFNKLFALFEGYNLGQFDEAIKAVSIQDAGIAIGAIILSLCAIFYNEDEH